MAEPLVRTRDRKRRQLLIVGLAALVIAAIVMTRRYYARPPEYQGRSIVEWFADYQRVRTNYLQTPRVIVVQTPTGAVVRTFMVTAFSATDTVRDHSREALEGMGTNGAYWLARQLRRGDGAVAGVYQKLFTKLPATVQKALRPPIALDEIHSAAAMALGAVGTNALPVMPMMMAALKQESRPSPTRDALIRTLQGLPVKEHDFDPILTEFSRRGNFEAVTTLIRELRLRTAIAAQSLTNAFGTSNSFVRQQALYAMYRFEQHSEIVVPTLILAFNSGDRSLLEQASGVLQSFTEKAAPALPALIQALQSPDPEMRYQAVRVIEAIGTNAVVAASVLQTATHDTNDMVRCVAERALCNVTR